MAAENLLRIYNRMLKDVQDLGTHEVTCYCRGLFLLEEFGVHLARCPDAMAARQRAVQNQGGNAVPGAVEPLQIQAGNALEGADANQGGNALQGAVQNQGGNAVPGAVEPLQIQGGNALEGADANQGGNALQVQNQGGNAVPGAVEPLQIQGGNALEGADVLQNQGENAVQGAVELQNQGGNALEGAAQNQGENALQEADEPERNMLQNPNLILNLSDVVCGFCGKVESSQKDLWTHRGEHFGLC